MTESRHRIRKTVGPRTAANPLDRVWRLAEFLRRLGVVRQGERPDDEPVRKAVGQPR